MEDDCDCYKLANIVKLLSGRLEVHIKTTEKVEKFLAERSSLQDKELRELKEGILSMIET